MKLLIAVVVYIVGAALLALMPTGHTIATGILAAALLVLRLTIVFVAPTIALYRVAEWARMRETR